MSDDRTYRICDFCGKEPDFGMWSSPFQYLTHGKKWCGCKEGEDLGARLVLARMRRENVEAWLKNVEPYDADAPCPKCGNPIRTTEYRACGEYLMGTAGSPQWPHIIRKCGRCTHSEYQLPLDFDVDKVAPKLVAS